MDKRRIFCVVLAAILFCAGGRVTAQGGSGPAPGTPVLYAAGYEGGNDDGTAMIWKIDGSGVTPLALTGGTRDSRAYAVAVLP
ncbi:MAG: hypothetical protein LBC31_12175 [Treponema sp.]|jgi:hypothetical protein|nr:hypothetical protein [Treponema sp.]